MSHSDITFNQSTKAAILSEKPQKICCKKAQLLGILLFGQAFSEREIRFVTENETICDRTLQLVKQLTSLDSEADDCKETLSNQFKLRFVGDKAKTILAALGYENASTCYTIRSEIFACDACKVEFLKGAFLACGNVSDPEKSYHLEMTVAYFNLSRELLLFLKNLQMEGKYTKRSSHYVIYFKESEKIADFLALLGAVKENFGFYNALITKDLRNRLNRINNCETANMQKHIATVARQLDAIEILEKNGTLFELSDEIQNTARLRRENPDLSLAELAALHTPPITKSCVNRRLQKLIEHAGKSR